MPKSIKLTRFNSTYIILKWKLFSKETDSFFKLFIHRLSLEFYRLCFHFSRPQFTHPSAKSKVRIRNSTSSSLSISFLKAPNILYCTAFRFRCHFNFVFNFAYMKSWINKPFFINNNNNNNKTSQNRSGKRISKMYQRIKEITHYIKKISIGDVILWYII